MDCCEESYTHFQRGFCGKLETPKSATDHSIRALPQTGCCSVHCIRVIVNQGLITSPTWQTHEIWLSMLLPIKKKLYVYFYTCLKYFIIIISNTSQFNFDNRSNNITNGEIYFFWKISLQRLWLPSD